MSRTPRRLATLLAGIALSVAAAVSAAAVHPDVRNARGWYPPDDPESLSVTIGRRLNAPRVALPFQGGAPALDALGRAVVRALRRAQADSLRALCVTEREFERILWREFPQSRPVTGLEAADAWALLGPRNLGGTARALNAYAGRSLTFVRWDRADTVARYRNFRLHQGLSLVVRDADGREESLDVVRAVAERRGRFKIYSMKD